MNDADPTSTRIQIGAAASLQVAVALSRPPRVIPELLELFSDDAPDPTDDAPDGEVVASDEQDAFLP